MQSILVTTDFSECARYAFDASIELAKKFGATLQLVHGVSLPNHWEQLNPSQKEKFPETIAAIKSANNTLQEFIDQNPNISIAPNIIALPLAKGIQSHLAAHSADLIVMGSNGASGANEFFIGSNTQKVVRQVHCPVLIVKKPLEHIDFKKVVYASGFNENEKEAFLQFKTFIQPFNPAIHLVAVHTSTFFQAPAIVQMEAMDGFKLLADPLPVETHLFRNMSIEQGIRFFADEIKADLIVVSNHHRHPIKRSFIGSNVEALVNHAQLPVLTIDY